MAKSGRAFADRKKVEVLTAAKTVEVADCGTLFVLNLAGGFTVTLPSIATAGNGWWCKFIVRTAPSGADYVIDLNGSDAITGVIVSAEDAAGSTDSAGTAQVEFKDGKAIQGDQVEIVCDGSRWYAVGYCNVQDGIDMA